MGDAKTVFLKAIQHPAAEWEDVVRNSANGSQAVIDEVRSLLQAHSSDSEARKILDQDVGQLIDHSDSIANNALEGQQFGNYHLRKKIGGGGNGTVYQASQSAPVERDVAVKLINVANSQENLARFKLECEVAAKMEHPNIARVYDVGLSNQFGPFLVMELIDGQDIVEHCQTHRLSIEKRIELVKFVCLGIRYAHQHGCIHRDIKPNNVLVQVIDDEPVPKVIDFGIAKFDSPDLNNVDHRLTTDGQFLGSLVYSSPEQIEAGQQSVDVRSDIYSIGVILFELLTGELPLSKSTLSSVGLSEQIRLLTDSEIEPPSKRVQPLDNWQDFSFASNSQWASALNGELDWIVGRCLQKSKTDRYQDVGDLIRDLDHFLRGQPVSVGPPSIGYKISRFVRRNKKRVYTFVGLAIIAMLGLLGTLSERYHAQKAEIAKEIERERAAETQQFFQYFTQQLSENDDWIFNILIDESMTATLRRWNSQGFKDDETADALRATAAVVYFRIGKLKKAEQQMAMIRQNAVGFPATDPRVLRLSYLDALKLKSENELELALQKLKTTLAQQEKHLGANHDDTLLTLQSLAILFRELGQFETAINSFQQLIDRRSKKLGPHDELTLAAQHELLNTFIESGNTQKQIELATELLDLRESKIENFSNKNFILAFQLHRLYRAQGDTKSTIKYLEKCCVNLDHIGAANANYRTALAKMYADEGDLEQAIKNQKIAIKNFAAEQKALGINFTSADKFAAATEQLENYESQQKKLLPKRLDVQQATVETRPQ